MGLDQVPGQHVVLEQGWVPGGGGGQGEVVESSSGGTPVLSSHEDLWYLLLMIAVSLWVFYFLFSFFFPCMLFFLLCGSFELKTHRVVILSSHKVQLSQVSSTLTCAVSVAILFSGDKIGNWTHGKFLLASVLHSNWLSCSCSKDSCQPVLESCLTLVKLALVPTLVPRSASHSAGVSKQLRKGLTILQYTGVLAPTVVNGMLTQKLKNKELNLAVRTEVCRIACLLTTNAQGCCNNHCCCWVA